MQYSLCPLFSSIFSPFFCFDVNEFSFFNCKPFGIMISRMKLELCLIIAKKHFTFIFKQGKLKFMKYPVVFMRAKL